MANFIGDYECKIDAKGRILFPAGLKKQLDPEAQEHFVINRGFEGCLVLFPKNEWDKESEVLKKLNLFIEKHRKFHRLFHNGAIMISLDSNSRLLLPHRLMKEAGIDKEVVLMGLANKIEIWAKNRYDKAMTTDDVEFSKLAEEVMGKENIKNDE